MEKEEWSCSLEAGYSGGRSWNKMPWTLRKASLGATASKIKMCNDARWRQAAPRHELTGLFLEPGKDIVLLRDRDEEDKLSTGAGAAFTKHWVAPVTDLLFQPVLWGYTFLSKELSQQSLVTEKSYRVVLLVVSSMHDSEGHHVSTITWLAYTTSLQAWEWTGAWFGLLLEHGKYQNQPPQLFLGLWLWGKLLHALLTEYTDLTGRVFTLLSGTLSTDTLLCLNEQTKQPEQISGPYRKNMRLKDAKCLVFT